MTAPIGETRNPLNRSDATSRTLLIIAAAVLIGLFVLWKAFDGGDDNVEAGPTDTTAPAASADGNPDGTSAPLATETAPTTSINAEGSVVTSPPANGAVPVTPPVTNAPATVKVLVANGTGEQGVASLVTDKIAAAAYVTESPGNALPTEASRIYYKPGYAGDAQAVLAVVGAGASPDIVQEAPATAFVEESSAERAASAHVIVVIGTDRLIPF